MTTVLFLGLMAASAEAATAKAPACRTRAGEDRLGLSADAVVGCLKYQFGVIFNPSHPGDDGKRTFQDEERDMASFLGDLRLERVDDPIERLKELGYDVVGDSRLKPIVDCMPHG